MTRRPRSAERRPRRGGSHRSRRRLCRHPTPAGPLVPAERSVFFRRSESVRVELSAPRSPGARPLAPGDTGRATVGRRAAGPAGPFSTVERVLASVAWPERRVAVA